MGSQSDRKRIIPHENPFGEDFCADNHYDILGLPWDATGAEIKAQIRRLSQKYHPDKADGNEEKFKLVKEAEMVLLDPNLRKAYDESLQYGGVPRDIIFSAARALRECGQVVAEKINYDTKYDFIDLVKQTIIEKIKEGKRHEEDMQKQKRRIEKFRKRLKRRKRKGQDVLGLTFDQRVRSIQEDLKDVRKAISVLTFALELANGYGFDADPSEGIFHTAPYME